MGVTESAMLDSARLRSGDFVEPDWRRLPGYRDVTREEWESSRWQLAHSVKNVRQLKDALGANLSDSLADDIERDQQSFATMPLLVPPQMLNTMDERNLRDDPVRRYMLPAYSDRDSEWPSHPRAERDSLHERHMRAADGQHRGRAQPPRRPGASLHAPRVLRSRLGVAEPPARRAGQPARARHVGRRGADAPLSAQGPRRAVGDVPSVLRPLHPDGPRRPLDRPVREVPLRGP